MQDAEFSVRLIMLLKFWEGSHTTENFVQNTLIGRTRNKRIEGEREKNKGRN
jgi:hypothetical protein